ncbi:MAG TPA: hypothetical protein VK596_03715 [Edaphobacter sp.]|nr:hypothetical protein [Edaphobacter sp.]
MISIPPERKRWIPVSPEDHAEVLCALEEVLESSYFTNSKRYPALLRYVVEQTLLGHGDALKERTVGIDVFGRPPDYDTNLDTIVRYSAGEVRKRLALHNHEVSTSSIQISLTARSYRPEFLRLIERPVVSTPSTTEESAPDFSVATSAPPARSHRLTWVALSAVLLLLAASGIGLRLWNHTRSDPEARFWSPILSRKTPTILSLGGVTFSARSSTGTQVASDQSSVNPYISFENGLAMGRVAALLNSRGGEYRVQSAASTTLAQIRENPTVLVGAYNNDWTYRMVEPLRFHFTRHPEERILDAQQPGRFWERDHSKPFGETPDYALVARFRNPSTDSMIVVLAGLQRFGTDAASQFATSRDLLEEFNRQVGQNWRDKNIEVVLRVDVVNGRVGAPIIEAFHVW